MQTLERIRESTVYGEMAKAWRWWTGELGAMIPERVRGRLGGRRHSLIYVRECSVEIDRLVDGAGEKFIEACALDGFAADNWAELDALTQDCRIRLVLGLPDIHVIELALPKVARSRLRAAIGLQLRQLAPLEPEHLVWAFEITGMRERDIAIRVAMIRNARIAQLQSLFETHCLRIPPIEAQCEDGLIRLVDGEEPPRDPERRNVRLGALAGCALLLSIPVTSWLGTVILKGSAERKIASLEAGIGPRVEAERRWRNDEALRQALLPLARIPAASGALDQLARRLPVTAYAESVEQAPDRSMLITVSTTDAEKTLAALGGASEIPGPSLVDQTAASQPGRTTATYRTLPR